MKTITEIVNEAKTRIQWKGDSVYVDGYYAGYIDCLNSRTENYYGLVFNDKNDNGSTVSMGLTEGRKNIVKEVNDYINANFDDVLATAIRIEKLNNK